jgi:DNA-binding SARP family transcriptional activator
MDFGLLGPLQILDRGVEVRLSGDIRRILLATLLLEGGRPVPVERLVECCWGDAAPNTAVSSLHNHVMALRQVLQDGDGLLLQHGESGYLIHIEPGELDTARFAQHLRTGRACHQNADWPRASAELAAALASWRGEVLAGLPARPHRTSRR